MRIALALLLIPRLAHADECDGEAASSIDCNALDRKGAMSVSSGWRIENFDPAGHDFEVKHIGFANAIGHINGDTLSPLHGNGFYIDVRVHMTPYWYFGVDTGASWSGQQSGTYMGSGWDSSGIISMGLLVGARIPFGRFSLRGEVAGGVYGATLEGSDLRADCAAPLIQPRMALDAWFHHYWALEAFAGTNMLATQDTVFGLGLAFHSQAFDGRN